MPNPCDSHYKGRSLERAWRTSVEVQTALNIEIGPWRQLLTLVLYLVLPFPCFTFLFCFSSLSPSAGETLPGATLVCMENHSQIHDIHYKWGIRFGTHVIEQKFLCVTIFPSVRTQLQHQVYSGGSWTEYVGPHAPWPHVSLIRLPWTFYWFILNKVEKNTWEMGSLRWREEGIKEDGGSCGGQFRATKILVFFFID